ncbi:heavy-metal-associated domain-containing protein [Streptomyces gobiensis]|uniref:heavy-metal-associated domain-containing protein n=1 Tax=Streptomyces gobiensis TaxID=2875706 RepID=UPI001E381670|nr:cation transporter [Streptomyces gobiensis]UGY91264.1 cation transporter [Streptomyces gobiensis]
MGAIGTQDLLLHVQGMTCTGCEERIGKVLSRLEGVRETSADHRSGNVRVAFDPGQVTPDMLAERIEQAGYQVTGREQSAS